MVLAACHVHSDWSYDGHFSLRNLTAQFARRGYRVLLMTEHDRGFTPRRLEQYRRACADASSDQMLVVPGIEYSDADNIVHILTWGDIPFLGEGRKTDALLRDVTQASGVAIFAHPNRKLAWQHFAPTWSEHLLGVEVWNRKTDGWAPSRSALALATTEQLRPFVGLDFHRTRQMFPLSMQLRLEGPLSDSVVLHALQSHAFRALALGRPLENATCGWFGTALRSLETCRTAAASTYRHWRKSLAV